MSVHPVNLLISVVVSALLAYAIVLIGGDAITATVGVGSFITLASTLGLAIGVRYERGRVGTNVRLVSALFFAGLLVTNGAFSLIGHSQAAYVITTGIFFMVFVLIAHSLGSAAQ